MKFFVVAMALIAVVAAQDESMYTTKFDNINLDEILQSDRLFKNYYNCLTDAGPCTPEGNELKRVLPDALETNCAKCSQKQRDAGTRAIKYMTESRPEEWKVLRARFDPENKYVSQYLADAEKEGIKL
ncbi:ejaculatory bulb-specific protein 3-like [Aedes albopictus]|uniref:Protein serine/threonine kinase n=1 Tax=Aedes albopictus TaxID=7160 RepID=A0ABM1ZSP4_AEDAL|nr:ejaculatory bulb-specific protein 3-like [Aedes albopictus]